MTLFHSAGMVERKVLARMKLADPSSFLHDLGKLILLLLFGMSVTWANVCTPYSAPANGPYPAIPASGIDAINWSIARVQWTTDNSANYYHEVRYACSGSGCPAGSTWGGTSARSSYPLAQGVFYGSVPNTVMPLGTQLANLLPNVTYHVLGQSSPDGGSTWCSNTDQTFTTLSKPSGTVLPTTPKKPVIPTVAYNGTHWVFGSNCGTGFTDTTQAVQDCFTNAKPGDDIAFPPGQYKVHGFALPNGQQWGVFPITCSQATNACTQTSGTAPANGTQIILANAPAPVNSGIPYYVVNSSGNTFKISYDGVTPITFATYPSGTFPGGGSGSVYQSGTLYRVYPITQPYIFVHSTAASNLLPPSGVRIGPDSLTQYLPNMPQFVANDPVTANAGDAIISYNSLVAGYYFQNIVFTTDPTVATSSGNGVDPIAFGTINQMPTTAYNFVWDQCPFIPAGPPSRSVYAQFSGGNIAVINSMQTGLDYWQANFDTGGSANFATVTSSSITFPATTVSWPGSDGTIATRHQCVMSPASITLTSGTSSGNAITWIDPPTCTWVTQIPTGITATGTNMTIQNVTTPAVPTYTFNSVAYCSAPYPASCAYQLTGWNALYWDSYGMAINSGSFTNGNGNYSTYGGGAGISKNRSESGTGFLFSAGAGPFMVYNTFQQGAGIAGVFIPEDLAGAGASIGSGGCPGAVPCNPQYIPSNITHQRSTITTNPCYFRDNACWNGGNYSWRNMDEYKQAQNVMEDGNIFGPYYAQIGLGECSSRYNWGRGTTAGATSYQNGSGWIFTNNTCLTNTGFATGDYNDSFQETYPAVDFYVHNNLFIGLGYGGASAHPSLGAHYTGVHTDVGCIFGALNETGGWTQNFIFDHNTVFGRAGCQPYLWWQAGSLSSGIQVTNNILDLTADTNGVFNSQGLPTYIAGGTPDTPDCSLQNGKTGAAMFACLNAFTWASNVIVPTYSVGYPANAPTEWTSAQISTLQSTMPSTGSLWPSGATLANRLNGIGWFNSTLSNYRLKSNSPYISGAKASTDGHDVGVDMDALEVAQGKVSNVRTYGSTSTTTTIGWYAPDSFSCGVDWGTTAFWNGSGTWTRIPGTTTTRVQSITLTGLPAHGQIYYRVNCAAQQPTGSVQLP